MSDIDQRVVEMQFDNKDFEKNVKTSLNTLDKLKNSLKLEDSAKGLEELSKAGKSFTLDNIADSCDKIADRFSTMGIIGMRVLENLTDSAMSFATNFVKSVSVDQIASGWTKYEQKTASVQTLMNSTGKSIDEINGYLNKLMWFSDETSYGFTDMTSSLAQLTTSGGDIDKLIPMIEGIANATAYAGKGTAEFSRAIYNLNQSYSAGYLQYMDWKSLDLAGVSSTALKQTFIDTAKALGKLTDEGKTASGELVTIANFGTTLSDKWADTEVMEAAFGKFAEVTEEAYKLVQSGEAETATEAYEMLAGAFDDVYYNAARSGQEAKTFTEAIDSVKDAVSSSWMTIFEKIFGDYAKAKTLWTDLTENLWTTFAQPVSDLADWFGNVMDSPWEQLKVKVEDAGLSLDDFTASIEKIYRESGTLNFDDIIEKYGSLDDAIENGAIGKRTLTKALQEIQNGLSETSTETSFATEQLQKMTEMAKLGLEENWTEWVKYRDWFNEQGYDYASYWASDGIQEIVKSGRELTVEDLQAATKSSTLIEKLAESTSESVSDVTDNIVEIDDETSALLDKIGQKGGRELFTESFLNIVYAITGAIQIAHQSLAEFFSVSEEGGYSFLVSLNKLTSKLALIDSETGELTERGERFKKVIDGILSIVSMLIKGIKTVFNILSPLVDVVKTFYGVIKDLFKGFTDWIDANPEVSEGLSDLKEMVSTAREYVQAFADSINTKMLKALEDLKNLIPDDVTSFSELYEYLKALAKTKFNNLKAGKYGATVTAFSKIAKHIQNAAISLKDNLIYYLSEAYDWFKNLPETINSFIQSVEDAGGPVEYLKQQVSNLVTKLIELKDKAFDKLQTSKIVDIFNQLKEKVPEVKKAVADFLSDMNSRLQNLDIRSVVVFLAALATIPTILAIGNAFKSFSTMLSSVTGVINKVKTALGKLTGQTKANTIKEYAISIGILAVSLALLAKVDEGGHLSGAINAFIVLSAAILIMTAAFSAITKFLAPIESATSVFLIFAGALVMLSAAMLILNYVNTDNLLTKFEVLIVLSAMITVFSTVLAKYAPKLSSGSIMMLSFAASIFILTNALQNISNIEFDKIQASMETLVVILATFIGLAMAMSVGGFKFGSGLGMTGMVLSLLVFVKVLQKLADPEYLSPDIVSQLISNIQSIIAVFVLLLGLAVIARIGGVGLLGVAATILSISASLLIVYGAIKLISKMKKSEIEKAQPVVDGILALFALIIASSYFAGEHALGVAAAILIMSVALYAIWGAMKLFGKMDDVEILKGFGTIVSIFAAFGVLMYASKFTSTASTGALVAMSAALMVLVLALSWLAIIPMDQLYPAALALGVALVGLGIALAGARDLSASSALGIAAAVIAIIAISKQLAILADYDWLSILSAAASISITLLAISASLKILSTVELSWGQLAKIAVGLIALSASIVVISFALSMLSAATPTNLIASMISLVAVLAAFAAVSLLLSGASGAILLVSVDLLVFGVALGVVGAGLILLLEGLGALGDALKNIGSTIANLVSSKLDSSDGLLGKIGKWLSRDNDNSVAEAESKATELGETIGNNITEGATNNIDTSAIVDKTTEATDAAASAVSQNGTEMEEASTSFFGKLTSGLGNIDISSATSSWGYDLNTGFTDSMDFSSITNTLSSGLTTSVEDVDTTSIGNTIGTNILDGINNTLTDDSGTSVETVVSNFADALDSEDFTEAGSSALSKFIDGLTSGGASKAISAVTPIVSSAVSKINAYKSNFVTAGSNLIQGFINGMAGLADTVNSTAWNIGKNAVASLNSGAGNASPSHKTFKSGVFFDKGFINGMLKSASTVYNTSEEIGTTAVDAISSAVSKASSIIAGETDLNPVISPVLDLTNVTNGAREISGLFSAQQSYNLGITGNGQNGTATSTVTYNQYNYSPKALSRIEIYRQTKNLLNA